MGAEAAATSATNRLMNIGYESSYETHIRPELGNVPAGRGVQHAAKAAAGMVAEVSRLCDCGAAVWAPNTSGGVDMAETWPTSWHYWPSTAKAAFSRDERTAPRPTYDGLSGEVDGPTLSSDLTAGFRSTGRRPHIGTSDRLLDDLCPCCSPTDLQTMTA